MKNYILLLVFFCLMLQSCTSYKTVRNDSPTFVGGKIYKIKQGEKWMKVKVVSSDENTIKVKHKSESKFIERASITAVKERKFSVVKTVLLVPVAVTTVAVGAYIADPKINFEVGPVFSSPN